MQEETKKRFAVIRKQLDQLGYRQKLDVDSLPLAEKLMADLMRASEVGAFEVGISEYQAPARRGQIPE